MKHDFYIFKGRDYNTRLSPDGNCELIATFDIFTLLITHLQNVCAEVDLLRAEVDFLKQGDLLRSVANLEVKIED